MLLVMLLGFETSRLVFHVSMSVVRGFSHKLIIDIVKLNEYVPVRVGKFRRIVRVSLSALFASVCYNLPGKTKTEPDLRSVLTTSPWSNVHFFNCSLVDHE